MRKILFLLVLMMVSGCAVKTNFNIVEQYKDSKCDIILDVNNGRSFYDENKDSMDFKWMMCLAENFNDREKIRVVAYVPFDNIIIDGVIVIDKDNYIVINNIENGIKNGFSELYYKDVLKEKGIYKDGNKVGVWKKYYDDGKIESEIKYNEKSNITSLKEYHKNGKIAVYINNNGKIPVIKIYDENGRLQEVRKQFIEFVDSGTEIGKFTENLLNSYKVSNSSEISKNKKNGLVKTYYDNGNIKTEKYYKKGVKSGISREYDENGNLIIEENYRNGELDGLQKLYSEGGILLSETNYKNGKESGLQKRYYPNGIVAADCINENGTENRVCRYYSSDGKLINEVKVKDGVISND